MKEQLGPSDYQELLGIQWPVQLQFTETDRPRIITHPQDQHHQILMPHYHRQEPFFMWRAYYVHELVHCALSEQLDPIFGTIFFHPSINFNEPINQIKAHQTYLAQQLIDVWVTDRMARLDSSLVEEDFKMWQNLMQVLAQETLVGSAEEYVVGHAIQQAQMERHQLTRYRQQQANTIKIIRSAFGARKARTARELAVVHASLPPLPENQAKALKKFEIYTQQAAQILGYSTTPQIVDHQGRNVWLFD